jgi:hypothetical protein
MAWIALAIAMLEETRSWFFVVSPIVMKLVRGGLTAVPPLPPHADTQ